MFNTQLKFTQQPLTRNYMAGAVKKVTASNGETFLYRSNDNRLRVQIFVVVFALWRECTFSFPISGYSKILPS